MDKVLLLLVTVAGVLVAQPEHQSSKLAKVGRDYTRVFLKYYYRNDTKKLLPLYVTQEAIQLQVYFGPGDPGNRNWTGSVQDYVNQLDNLFGAKLAMSIVDDSFKYCPPQNGSDWCVQGRVNVHWNFHPIGMNVEIKGVVNATWHKEHQKYKLQKMAVKYERL